MLLEHETEFLLAHLSLDFGRKAKQTDSVRVGRLLKIRRAAKCQIADSSDMIAAFLESRGIKNYLVDTGGEIMAKGGKPNGQPWIVGIEKPAETMNSEQVVQTRLALRDKGLVTSGSTRKYVERDGKRYSHCIDPHTGYPVEHQVLSVTVLAGTSVWADALASICMVMGMEQSLPFIESMDGVEAYYIFVNEKGELETFATEGFRKLIVE